MTHRLPTAAEINVFDSLEERTAVQNFLGKDLAQAECMFREGFRYYREDLMHMGPAAFGYYVPAAISYLKSREADGDSDAAGTFCGLIEYRLDHDAATISDAKPVLREGIREILDGFSRYECDVEIDGDVEARYRALLPRL